MLKSKVFIKNLFSYLIVLLIPILCISIFLNTEMIDILRDEVIDSTTSALVQMNDVIDEYFTTFNNISSYIGTNKDIVHLISSDNIDEVPVYPYVTRAIGELEKYRSANPIISDIFIFFKDRNTVLSSRAKYDFSYFPYRIYILDDANVEFKGVLEGIDGETLMPITGVKTPNRRMDIISYFRAFPIDSPIPNSVLMINIDQRAIEDLMRNTLAQYNGSAYILDENSNVITSVNTGSSNNLEIQDVLPNLNGEDLVSSQIIGGEIVVSVRSNKTGWRYVNIIPSDKILKEVTYVKLKAIAILLLSFMLGFSIVYFFSKINYSHIRQLADLIQVHGSSAPNGPVDKGDNELEFINDSIMYYIDNNKALEERVHSQMPVIENSFFRKLLRGQIVSKQDVEDMLKFLNIECTNGYYSVLIVHLDNNIDLGLAHPQPIREMAKLAICDIVDRTIDDRYWRFIIEEDYGQLDIILGLSGESHKAKVELIKIAEDIRDVISKELNIIATIGVGGIYDELLILRRSYMQALKALEYKMVMGYGSIIPYDNICNRNIRKHCYSFEQENELLSYLRMGDYLNVQYMLDEIVSTMKNEPISLETIKCIYFDIINTAIKVADELDVDHNILNNVLPDLSEGTTLDEVYVCVCNFYREVCDIVNDAKNSSNIELRDSIVEYINENYSDPMLSVDSIADEFSKSSSYVSRFFKEQMGYSLTEYIHRVRLDRAKQLLADTDDTIAQIGEIVGYNSPHNFSRVFKRYEQVTPTQYRTSTNILT